MIPDTLRLTQQNCVIFQSMRSAGIFTLLFFFIFSPLTAKEKEPTAGDFFLTAGSIVSENILIWSFSRFITRPEWAFITPESMKYNLQNPWVWDQNNFAVNHYGHPYQGGLYYMTARSRGYEFLSGSLFTAFGSLQWEYLMETERPSLNDLITTTLGGITFGEIFFRLSESVYSEESLAGKAGSWLLWPGRFFIKESDPRDKKNISGSLAIGLGSSAGSIYIEGIQKFEFNDFESLDDNFQQGFLGDIYYGDPFHVQRPFDSFTLHYDIGFLNLTPAVRLFSESQVWSKNISERSNIGISIHYDAIIHEFINFGANSTGIHYTFQRDRPEGLSVDLRTYLNWVLMGSSQILYLKYEHSLYPPQEETRDYNLSTGQNTKLYLKLKYKDIFSVFFNYSVYRFNTIDASVPEEGYESNDIIGFLTLAFEKHILSSCALGLNISTMDKDGMYKNKPHLNEFSIHALLYFKMYF